jgi:hypothetical protein
MIKQSKKNSKLVTVIARVFIIENANVVYIVRSSNGVDTYNTTLVNGKAVGCTCPAYKPCYHMIQVEQKEAQRTASTQQIVEKLAARSTQPKSLEVHRAFRADDAYEQLAEEKSLSDPWEGLDADERATAYGVYLMSIGAA